MLHDAETAPLAPGTPGGGPRGGDKADLSARHTLTQRIVDSLGEILRRTAAIL